MRRESIWGTLVYPDVCTRPEYIIVVCSRPCMHNLAHYNHFQNAVTAHSTYSYGGSKVTTRNTRGEPGEEAIPFLHNKQQQAVTHHGRSQGVQTNPPATGKGPLLHSLVVGLGPLGLLARCLKCSRNSRSR